jgi:carboxypeptidase Q
MLIRRNFLAANAIAVRSISLCVLTYLLFSASVASAQVATDGTSETNKADEPSAVQTNSASPSSRDTIQRIREEGLKHSQVMTTLSYLTEMIGPRLTGSPNMKRANEWTRSKLAEWGLTNAHLEAWGPFGRGWALKRLSAQIVEPYAIPLIAYPKAWSPGLARPLNTDVIFLDARNESDLEKYRGKLKGAAVLIAPIREVNPRFEPLSGRMDEAALLRYANVSDPRYNAPYEGRPFLPRTNTATSGQRRGGGGGGGFNRSNFTARVISFLLDEGAALAISPSTEGDGGVVFVSSVSLPNTTGSQNTNAASNFPRVWATNAPTTIPQIALSTEDYNHLVRMIQQGAEPKIAAEMEVQFFDDDLMAYNTIGEIPGSDLKREIVMIGGHLDSWHSGTGATDNGAGVAATMEAMRILKTLDLKPRRTIRIGLWSGEEQGLMGSRAYVSNHFGYYPGGGGRFGGRGATNSSTATGSRGNSQRNLVRKREYETFSVYFNLDHGAGKIRGVFLDGNEAARPLFAKWLQPFADLGAETVTLANSGGTDHISFETIGLPGFPFIQDPLDYWTRTHHSSADVLDRVPAEDLKQAATIVAAFAWQAAMLDEKIPRKPADQ